MQKSKQTVLLKICNAALKSITSLETPKNSLDELQMMRNAEMTNGTSKCMLFVKEKKSCNANSHVARLLLQILCLGREDLGWLQTAHLQEHNNAQEEASSIEDKRASGMTAMRNIEKSERTLSMSSIHKNSSSEYSLPISSPALRILLKLIEKNCIEVSQIELVVSELKLTLLAVLIGLKFAHERDAGLQVLVALRHALKNSDDLQITSPRINAICCQ